GFARLPRSVEDALINVGALSVLTWLASVPGTHIGRGTDWLLGVKDGRDRGRVLEADRLPGVLDDLGQVHRQDDPPAQIIPVVASRRNADPVAPEQLLYHPDELGDKHGAAPFPGTLHLVVDVASRLKDDLLGAETRRQFLQFDVGHMGDIR